MLSYLKNLKFNNAITSHPNFEYSPSISSYNNGESIAILSDIKHNDIVEKFSKNISNKGTKVSLLFFDGSSKQSEIGYTNKDVSWAGIPRSDKVAGFLENEYDRYYFLENKWSSHFLYISRLVKCRLSVGPLFQDRDFHFDLSIDIENQSVDYLAAKIQSELDHLSI